MSCNRFFQRPVGIELQTTIQAQHNVLPTLRLTDTCNICQQASPGVLKNQLASCLGVEFFIILKFQPLQPLFIKPGKTDYMREIFTRRIIASVITLQSNAFDSLLLQFCHHIARIRRNHPAGQIDKMLVTITRKLLAQIIGIGF